MKHHLDWSPYVDAGMGDAYADIPKNGGDYAKAIAACINSRQCETQNKLVMCPSYKVTEDPTLSTGGRVRLLKAALNEDLYEAALAAPDLARTMELCVSCKGCKRECESNVDMPLIKAEYLAQKAAKEGHSLRSRLLANTPAMLHAEPWLKPLIRLRNSSTLVAKIMEKTFGIAADVPLPKPSMLAYNDKHPFVPGREGFPEVVLFVDTFARHFEPTIAQAAVLVLQRAGYAVQIASPNDSSDRPLCCGRTYLAQGMVDKARAEAERLCKVLRPHVAAGRIIVGLEASCVLGLRDDAKAFNLGKLVEDVAGSTLLLEEFISKEIRAKRWDLKLTAPDEGKVLIHGHCHQKAVGAMKAMRRVLKAIDGLNFEIIESGCCGMAGTFGLEAEHAQMSKDMAAQSLIPTLKENPDAQVVANGFSCRHQMRSHKDDRAKHLALLLKESLH